ncbi:hypothetical protein GOP47_0015273 [Adiantum capillus-veneris]|uniref:Uncharacterized protein n=1 Tax=Adiantum capillus-veneris TaxID=13818 RepID=A0A9D4UJQ7_ADICA|nr:hypothetical protein GOP47_0015273 [Adiantum capillus-veneris]
MPPFANEKQNDGLNPKISSSKQKSNERKAARDQKSSAREVASRGTSANAYNPISGTFHALESIAADTGAGYLNGRFKSIDDEEDNASSNGGAGELECMSNNGSYFERLSGKSVSFQIMDNLYSRRAPGRHSWGAAGA